MSHTAAHSRAGGHDGHGSGHDSGHGGVLAHDNITLSNGSGLSLGLLLAGAVLLAAAIGAGVAMEGYGTQALAAVHIGAMSCLAMCLGGLFFTMVFHLTGAGWSVTVRRQFENLMKVIWFPLLIAGFIAIPLEMLVTKGMLFSWMNTSLSGEDVLYQEKSTFLNPLFFGFRVVFYALLWSYLVWKLWGYSTEQDRTGDKWLTNRARFTSSWGMLAFALSTAFASFDLLMSLDWRFFSTMWGVYYFAGAAFSSVPVVVIVLALLRRAGKLKGAVGEEHLHDLAKLMFGFTVFWAYIAFSQYFLIWYSAIPEETSFFLARKTGGWESLSIFLCVGHFILPFYILLWRFVRRSFALLALMASWAILMEAVDIYWIVRPMVYAGQPDSVRLGSIWLDVAGIGGVMLMFAGLLARRVASGPLVPLRDPRLGEALHHANYV
ncbi:MAG: hypothetical protein ACKVU4_10050 [Phycisphaerales bacterium]